MLVLAHYQLTILCISWGSLGLATLLAHRCFILFFSIFVSFGAVWALQCLPLPVSVIVINHGPPVLSLGLLWDLRL